MKPAPYRGSAPHNGTVTSRAAAVLQGQGRRLTTRERVVAFIWEMGAWGATRDEIAEALGMRLSSVCGRVGEEIERKGKNGEDLSRIRTSTVKRETSAGAKAFVLVAVAPVDARQLDLLGEKGPHELPRPRPSSLHPNRRPSAHRPRPQQPAAPVLPRLFV